MEDVRDRSGVAGLDTLLRGGFVSGRMYLAAGEPGTGKTLLGMHFLEQGLETGQTVLHIHGEESREEIIFNGSQIGIDITDAEFLDLGPNSDFFTEDRRYDLVEPDAVEQDQYTSEIHNAIRDIDPDRVVVDPITQLRYIEASEHQFRKRILSFMRFLKQRNTTVLGTATLSDETTPETEMHSLADGVIRLTHTERGRRINVVKHRGFGQRDGSHGLAIRDGGIEVFPALVPERLGQSFKTGQISSGIDTLDELLGGGIESGTVTFITGPTGVGKTTLATQLLAAAAEEDITSIAYLFEEGPDTFAHRAESIGIPVSELREGGRLSLEPIEPLAQSPEEFAHRVQQETQTTETDLVLIDGIGGYEMSIQGSRSTLVKKIHSLARHLKNQDVTVLITDEIPGITGLNTATSGNISYIADNILALTYTESNGTLEKVIGVVKKRASGFDNSLRAFELDDGVSVGARVADADGILQADTRSGHD